MKKILCTLLLLPMVLFFACSSDDDNGTTPTDTTPRLVASTTAPKPTMQGNPNEDAWSSVTGLNISLAGSGTLAKPYATSLSASAATSINVKAIIADDTLFMRFEWADDSQHVWRDAWTLTNLNGYNFTQNDVGFNEDQLFVMFTAVDSNWSDVWNWRSLTTEGGKLAEGYNYLLDADTLIRDNGAQVLAISNVKPPPNEDATRPRWVHKDQSSYTDYFLYLSDVVSTDTIAFDAGWTVGMMVPGYVIDYDVRGRVFNTPQSRWDTWTNSFYDAAADKYQLALAHGMNNGFADDLDFTALDSVRIKIVVQDNLDALSPNNSSQQSSSKDFWLILP